MRLLILCERVPDGFAAPSTRLPWSDEHDAPDECGGGNCGVAMGARACGTR